MPSFRSVPPFYLPIEPPPPQPLLTSHTEILPDFFHQYTLLSSEVLPTEVDPNPHYRREELLPILDIPLRPPPTTPRTFTASNSSAANPPPPIPSNSDASRASTPAPASRPSAPSRALTPAPASRPSASSRASTPGSETGSHNPRVRFAESLSPLTSEDEDEGGETGDASSEDLYVDVCEPGRIPKPDGSVSRPGGGGYTLQTALSWPDSKMKILKAVAKTVTAQHLDSHRSWTHQDPTNRHRAVTAGVSTMPELTRYQNAWPLRDAICMGLKYSASKYQKRQGFRAATQAAAQAASDAASSAVTRASRRTQ